MDDYIPEDPIPRNVFESLIEVIHLPSGYDIKVLTAPPTFFDPKNQKQPVVIGFAGTVYALFNETMISTCMDEEPKEMCACMARDIALNLGWGYILQNQGELGPPRT